MSKYPAHLVGAHIKNLGVGYDFNGITECGAFEIYDGVNAPEDNLSYIVLSFTGGATGTAKFAFQMAVDVADGNVWTRAYSGTAWSAWYSASDLIV